MSLPPVSARAISLYRQILRAANHWSNAEEKQYIRAEAGKLFREKRHVSGAEQEAALTEGETRLHYAQHYGIPYPRLHHKRIRTRILPQVDSGDTVPHTSDSKADSKLAQAAKRIGLRQQEWQRR